MGSVEYRCSALTKVNSVWPNLRLLIALYSPSYLRETGLRMCPPEKGRLIDAVRPRAVLSLQSALGLKYCETRACFAYFLAKGGVASLQSRLADGHMAPTSPGMGCQCFRFQRELVLEISLSISNWSLCSPNGLAVDRQLSTRCFGSP